MAEQPRDHAAIVDALVQNFERARWQPFFEVFGLNEHSSDNLVRLLILHLLLDHFLNVRLAETLVENRMDPDFDGILKEVAGVNMRKRLALAVKLGAISEETSRQLAEVNKVRNACVHYKPDPRGNFEAFPEIAINAFEACSTGGLAALKELLLRHAAK